MAVAMEDVEFEDVELEVPVPVPRTPKKALKVGWQHMLAMHWVFHESDEYFDWLIWKDKPTRATERIFGISLTRSAEVAYYRSCVLDWFEIQGHFQYATPAFFRWMKRCKVYYNQTQVDETQLDLERTSGRMLSVNYRYDIQSPNNQYLNVLVEVYSHRLVGRGLSILAPNLVLDDEDELNDERPFSVAARQVAFKRLRAGQDCVARPRPKAWLQPKSWPKFRP